MRHPIDAGPIFEGRELSRVLRSHASTFTTITSIPTELVQSGREPELSTVTRGLPGRCSNGPETSRWWARPETARRR